MLDLNRLIEHRANLTKICAEARVIRQCGKRICPGEDGSGFVSALAGCSDLQVDRRVPAIAQLGTYPLADRTRLGGEQPEESRLTRLGSTRCFIRFLERR